MSVVVSIDVREIEDMQRMFADLGAETMATGFKRALNKCGDKVYTMIVRTVTNETGAQQKRVRSVIRKVPASSRLVWKAVARDHYMSLKDFRARQTRRGVQTTLKLKSGAKQFVPHAFIVPKLGGHVFIREGDARPVMRGRYKGKMRQPIKKLYGPALPVQMIRGESAKHMAVLVEKEFIPLALEQMGLATEKAAHAHHLKVEKGLHGAFHAALSFVE